LFFALINAIAKITFEIIFEIELIVQYFAFSCSDKLPAIMNRNSVDAMYIKMASIIQKLGELYITYGKGLLISSKKKMTQKTIMVTDSVDTLIESNFSLFDFKAL